MRARPVSLPHMVFPGLLTIDTHRRCYAAAAAAESMRLRYVSRWPTIPKPRDCVLHQIRDGHSMATRLSHLLRYTVDIASFRNVDVGRGFSVANILLFFLMAFPEIDRYREIHRQRRAAFPPRTVKGEVRVGQRRPRERLSKWRPGSRIVHPDKKLHNRPQVFL